MLGVGCLRTGHPHAGQPHTLGADLAAYPGGDFMDELQIDKVMAA